METFKEVINKLSVDISGYRKGDDPQFMEDEEKALRVQRIAMFRSSSRGFPEKYHNVNIEELDEEQKKTGNEFLQNVKEKKSNSLWFCGYAGTGKTTLACAIAREFFLNGKTAKYIKSHLVVGKLKKNQETIESVIDELKSYSLIIIDEVGRYPESEWESYYLFAIIDELYNKGIFVIMISNLEKQKLGELLGAACVDRFKGIAKSVEFKNKSYRGTENELYL